MMNSLSSTENKMDQNIADLLKDAFPETDLEPLYFEDNIETVYSEDKPEKEPAMEDTDENKDTTGPWTMSDEDLEGTQNLTTVDKQETTESFSENSWDCTLDEHSVTTGSTLYGSSDDNEAQDKQLTFSDEECRENEFETDVLLHAETLDMLQKKKEDDYSQREDNSLLEIATLKGILGTESQMHDSEKTSHLLACEVDKLEHRSSASKENKTVSIDCPIVSIDDQSEDEMREFTEEDHERAEESLADYPSDLSQSENEGSSEGHDGRSPTHIDNEMENLETSSGDDDVQEKDITLDTVEVTHIKNDELDVEATSWKIDEEPSFQDEHDYRQVCVNYSFLNDNYTDKDDTRISDFGESPDSGHIQNFQCITQKDSSSECYKKNTNEQPDYDSDISSDGDYSKSQEEEADPISCLGKGDKNNGLYEQVCGFTQDLEKVELEDTDSQKTETHDLQGLSGISTFPVAGMEDSRMEDSSANGNFENSNSSLSKLYSLESKEYKSEALEVLDTGENINTLLPEDFWSSASLTDEDNLKFDEYEWEFNAGNYKLICDEEDDLLEEQDNDGDDTERDREKEQARIEAFNRYYESAEGDKIEERSHKVTFCLDPESSQYEEENSSEEDLNIDNCISELHPSEFSSVKPDQINQENSNEPSEVSDIENISPSLPEAHWPNLQLEEHDDDIIGEDVQITYSVEVTCDEKEELDNVGEETEGDWKQEQARNEAFNRYHEESFKGEKNEASSWESEARSYKAKSRELDQESSQNEDNESSDEESNTEDSPSSTANSNRMQTEDHSESDEPQERRIYTGRPKVLSKSSQKANKELKKHPKTNRCLTLLKSAFAVSLVTGVGVLSYWWVTDSLDWNVLLDMIQNAK